MNMSAELAVRRRVQYRNSRNAEAARATNPMIPKTVAKMTFLQDAVRRILFGMRESSNGTFQHSRQGCV